MKIDGVFFFIKVKISVDSAGWNTYVFLEFIVREAWFKNHKNIFRRSS
jgi:hypothetical protein